MNRIGRCVKDRLCVCTRNIASVQLHLQKVRRREGSSRAGRCGARICDRINSRLIDCKRGCPCGMRNGCAVLRCVLIEFDGVSRLRLCCGR